MMTSHVLDMTDFTQDELCQFYLELCKVADSHELPSRMSSEVKRILEDGKPLTVKRIESVCHRELNIELLAEKRIYVYRFNEKHGTEEIRRPAHEVAQKIKEKNN